MPAAAMRLFGAIVSTTTSQGPAMVVLSTRDSALDMARRGFAVFPLLPGSRVPIEAKRLKAHQQHLRQLAGGINRATTSLETIAEWFALEPSINYGVAAEPLCILDVDVKNGKSGIEDLIGLGVLPRTFTVQTGTGGLHIYFEAPAGGAGQANITKSIDVRGVGGYVVGPGSIVDGKRYSIVKDAPVAPIPANVAPLIGRPGERADRSARHLVPCGELDAPGSWDNAIAWLSTHAPAVEGSGGDAHTYKTACALKDFGLSQDSALDAMLMHWNDTCAPPWGVEELAQKVANAYSYGREPPASSAAALELPGLPAELIAELQAQTPPEAPETPPGPRFKPLDVDFDEAAMPPRRWIIKDLLLERALCGLVSDPGAGKSTLSLDLAICLALGNGAPLGFDIKGPGGIGPAEPRKVVLINNEDDPEEIQKRLLAFCLEHSIDRKELKGRLIVHSPDDDSPFKAFARHPETRQLTRTKAFAELDSVLGEYGAEVFMVDPMVEMHDGDENSNADVAAVMRGFRNLAKKHSAAGLIIHHTRKPPHIPGAVFAGDANVARGAKAFEGNVRALVTLFRMCAAEAEQYGISASARGRYTRLDWGKGSYSPAGAHTRWFETVSRTLLNGDSAPAVRPANMTEQSDRIAKVLHMQLRADVLAAGDVGLPLKTAAHRLAQDPMAAGEAVDALARRLRAVFELPRTFDGVTLVCEPDDAEKAKPRYVLRGQLEETPGQANDTIAS